MKRTQFHLRISHEEKELIDRAAELAGMSRSEFGRMLLVRYSLALINHKPGRRQAVLSISSATADELLNAVELRWTPPSLASEGEWRWMPVKDPGTDETDKPE